ncbi:hypothetical protein N0V88_003792 [Collariella sp. IMI 366227]|nr:hypothetical protein N0V88_003792 [Collariella sp. IMI 366227]
MKFYTLLALAATVPNGVETDAANNNMVVNDNKQAQAAPNAQVNGGVKPAGGWFPPPPPASSRRRAAQAPTRAPRARTDGGSVITRAVGWNLK